MTTTFVNLKSELTNAKEANELNGFDVYRSRIKCQCKHEFNRRDGVIIIDPSGQVIAYVIRCKSCTKHQSTI